MNMDYKFQPVMLRYMKATSIRVICTLLHVAKLVLPFKIHIGVCNTMHKVLVALSPFFCEKINNSNSSRSRY